MSAEDGRLSAVAQKAKRQRSQVSREHTVLSTHFCASMLRIAWICAECIENYMYAERTYKFNDLCEKYVTATNSMTEALEILNLNVSSRVGS